MTIYDWGRDSDDYLPGAKVTDANGNGHEFIEVCDTEKGIMLKHDLSNGRLQRYLEVAPAPLVVEFDIKEKKRITNDP